MCLLVDKRVKVSIKKGQIIAYKVLSKDNRSVYKKSLYTPGTIKSAYDRRGNRVSISKWNESGTHDYILHGIHVFLNKRDAVDSCKRWSPDMGTKVIKVIGFSSHLIGTGFFYSAKSAVFTKVKVIG